MGRGGGGFWEGHPKSFELKEGASQKMRGKEGHEGICTGLRGHYRANWEGGEVMQNVSETFQKPLPPLPIKMNGP